VELHGSGGYEISSYRQISRFRAARANRITRDRVNKDRAREDRTSEDRTNKDGGAASATSRATATFRDSGRGAYDRIGTIADVAADRRKCSRYYQHESELARCSQ
jgi:hypothetical protein